MTIQHLTIHRLGSIRFYETDFAPDLNWIDSRYTDEIAAAMAFLLCSCRDIPEAWLQENTRISATISLADTAYTVLAKPQGGRLQLFAADASGADATGQYQYALSHCPEQDMCEAFDGQDKTIPQRLYRYRYREDGDNLSQSTQRLADTDAFRSYLLRYIHSFVSEPVNSKKNYHTAITARGEFAAVHPEISGKVHLSETEEKLFFYICFLNIAEFWAGFEKIRDLHHEKKPLLIQNFMEFLDESANISNLIARMQKLKRQVIILCNTGKEI